MHFLFRFAETGSFGPRECHKKVFKSVTGGLFGGDTPKIQAAPIREPDPLPAPPSRSDAETEALAEENRKQNTPRRAGRASTFLTQAGLQQAASAIRFLGGSTAT